MIWLALLLGVLAVALLAAAWSVFATACLRPPYRDLPIEENVSPLWSAYSDEVIRGVHWFRDRETERVEILSHDGLRLRGYYLAHPEAKGTILLFHGFRSDGYTDFSCAYESYYAMGYSLLTVFQRAHGESEGRYITFGIKERFDCQRWAEYAYERFGPDHPLLLGGMSMGAATVLMATGLPLPPTVKGVVADCGFTSPWEVHLYLLRHKRVPAAKLLLSLADLLARAVAGFSFREYSTLTAMETNRLPILFLHGEADTFVPARFTQECYDACRSEKELLLVPGATHGVSYLVDKPRCQAALERFLRTHMEGGHD
ncbi:MAG: alpha/beta hydrolase [Oscillospiraceae bacterium]